MLSVDADGRCPVVNMAVFQIFTVQGTILFLPKAKKKQKTIEYKLNRVSRGQQSRLLIGPRSQYTTKSIKLCQRGFGRSSA